MSIFLRFECDVCSHGAKTQLEGGLGKLPPGWVRDGDYIFCSGKCYDKHIARRSLDWNGWTPDPKWGVKE